MNLAFTNDGTSCALQLPPWRLDPLVASTLIDEAFSAPRRSFELPLFERLALDSQVDGLEEELPCKPSTSGALPVEDIFANPAFEFSGEDHVLDIGAGDGRLCATAVLVAGASSAVGRAGCARARAFQWHAPPRPLGPEVAGGMPCSTSRQGLR